VKGKNRITLTDKIKAEMYKKCELSDCCVASELLALLLAEGSMGIAPDRSLSLVLNTHSARLAKRCYMHMSHLGVEATHSTWTDRRLSFGKSYKISVQGAQPITSALRALAKSPISPMPDLDSPMLSLMNLKEIHPSTRECCTESFLRGLFISRGSLTTGTGYNLELNVNDPDLLERILAFLSDLGLEMKSRVRNRKPLAYSKCFQTIADFLGMSGSHRIVMELVNNKLVKEVRNKINRTVNCDSANLNKTVNTAQQQMRIIDAIDHLLGLDNLPDKIASVASLRLKFPYESYEALGKLHDPRLTKSRIQYRLKQLEKIYLREIRRIGDSDDLSADMQA
jgi:hypothetical protein